MTFPIVNISVENWVSEDFVEYICYDGYIYTDEDFAFKEYYENKLFCDATGQIFKATGKMPMTKKWRNWFKFIPNVWKTKIVFEKTNRKMTVNELRLFLYEKITVLNQNEFTLQWKTEIENAKTHLELINGKNNSC